MTERTQSPSKAKISDQVRDGIKTYYLKTQTAPNALTATTETMDMFVFEMLVELDGQADEHFRNDEVTGNAIYLSPYGELILYVNETVPPGAMMISRLMPESDEQESTNEN